MISLGALAGHRVVPVIVIDFLPVVGPAAGDTLVTTGARTVGVPEAGAGGVLEAPEPGTTGSGLTTTGATLKVRVTGVAAA